MKKIYSMTFEDFEQYFMEKENKKYRAVQMYEWLYKKRISDLSLMNNINKQIKEVIKNDFVFDSINIIDKKETKDLKKYLFELHDGEKVESVLMYHDYGISICVSSQVGCNMGCKFCESGRLKKVRNLDANEMVCQILEVEKDIHERISHVVIMGIGEPFDNYENIIKFIKIINHGKGIDIGARHITVSTCGIIPKIKEFSNTNLQVNLAISLHAATDELRSKIMPINQAYPLKDLMKCLKEYAEKTNRRITFEYILLESVNDRKEDAIKLADLLKGMNCYVNLIPYNETENIIFKRTKMDQIMQFYDILKKNNITVTIRREFGSDVAAACGQLRADYNK